MSYSRRMVGLKRWVMGTANTPKPSSVQPRMTKSGDFLLDVVGTRNAKPRNHLPEFLAGGDVADANVAELLEVDQGQALGEQLAIDHALAEARDDPEADAARKLVHRGSDALQIVRLDMLQPVPEHDPVDALAALLGALGPAVPDQLGIKARLGDLVIFRVDLTDPIEVDEAVVHRRDERIRLEDRGTSNRVVAAGRVDHDDVSLFGQPRDRSVQRILALILEHFIGGMRQLLFEPAHRRVAVLEIAGHGALAAVEV